METGKRKINILYLFPGPTYRPDLTDFKGRFEMLSDHFEGEIYSWVCDKAYKNYQIGHFVFRGLVVQGHGLITRLRLAAHIIMAAINLSLRKKIDVIICYEPVFTGIVGAFLKSVFRCKLIIELNNSDIVKAMRMEGGKSPTILAKICISKILLNLSLSYADGIKLLTLAQKSDLEQKYHEKTFCFHDFVPTSFFEKDEKRMEKYLLFVGFPFYMKGVDILVKAFQKIADQFPDFELRLIGHLLQDEAKKCLGTWHPQVKFIRPMFYEKLKPYFLNCYALILPSRQEGMGRVLIEAMACGKPLIGADVGGIPSLIKDGDNGLLFKSENIDDLAQKLAVLIKEPLKAHEMGQRNLQYINEKYSDRKYCDHFSNMIWSVCDGKVL